LDEVDNTSILKTAGPSAQRSWSQSRGERVGGGLVTVAAAAAI